MNSISSWVSCRNRKRKFDYFIKTFKPEISTSILDVGYQDAEDYPGINYLEKNYRYRDKITALGIEEPIHFQKIYPEITVKVYDGKIFPFEKGKFDIVWSNAVVEHVGNRDLQKKFINELFRTSNKVFFTTPNKYFPIEVHTKLPLLHFLPKRYFDKILKLIGKDWATGDYMYLLSIKEMKNILEELNITDYKIKKFRFFFLVMDFAVVVN